MSGERIYVFLGSYVVLWGEYIDVKVHIRSLRRSKLRRGCGSDQAAGSDVGWCGGIHVV